MFIPKKFRINENDDVYFIPKLIIFYLLHEKLEYYYSELRRNVFYEIRYNALTVNTADHLKQYAAQLQQCLASGKLSGDFAIGRWGFSRLPVDRATPARVYSQCRLGPWRWLP